ncbi:MAG: hypothetical protein ACP5I4_09480 [Oceanipulchritudo sp.]
MIYLLDLNYTLVDNSPPLGAPPLRPFVRQIEQETYRQWLVELLCPHQVILFTARPIKYREPTLERINKQTGWEPMDAFFGEIRARPHVIKEHLLKYRIFPAYGSEGYFAFESNPLTQGILRHYGISSVQIVEGQLIT